MTHSERATATVKLTHTHSHANTRARARTPVGQTASRLQSENRAKDQLIELNWYRIEFPVLTTHQPIS